jgi:nucleotide-binding universal stress UspA family protein
VLGVTATPARLRIVAGVDGSTGSKNALRWAAHIARLVGGRLDVVAAWDYPPLYGLTAAPEFEFPEHDIEQSLARTVDEVLGDARPGDLRIKALAGPPAEILVTVSHGAYLLVVGSRGGGGFGGLRLGSVSDRVAEHAECPVLVVHDEQPPADPAAGTSAT